MRIRSPIPVCGWTHERVLFCTVRGFLPHLIHVSSTGTRVVFPASKYLDVPRILPQLPSYFPLFQFPHRAEGQTVSICFFHCPNSGFVLEIIGQGRYASRMNSAPRPRIANQMSTSYDEPPPEVAPDSSFAETVEDASQPLLSNSQDHEQLADSSFASMQDPDDDTLGMGGSTAQDGGRHPKARRKRTQYVAYPLAAWSP